MRLLGWLFWMSASKREAKLEAWAGGLLTVRTATRIVYWYPGSKENPSIPSYKSVHAVSGCSRTLRHCIGATPTQGTRCGATSITTTRSWGPNRSLQAVMPVKANTHKARESEERDGVRSN